MIKLTVEEACYLYLIVTGDDTYSIDEDPGRAELADDVNRALAAKSVKEAADILSNWNDPVGCAEEMRIIYQNGLHPLSDDELNEMVRHSSPSDKYKLLHEVYRLRVRIQELEQQKSDHLAYAQNLERLLNDVWAIYDVHP